MLSCRRALFVRRAPLFQVGRHFLSTAYTDEARNTLRHWQTDTEGTLGHNDFRVFLKQNDKRISPWHDVPLCRPNQLLHHYINEIPSGTRKKMEISKSEHMNPILQDVKDGVLRTFGAGDIPFNYGALPQTWEDPSIMHPRTGLYGDNDPLDAVEISATPKFIGQVCLVKVLGALALLDQGETDWKIIVIDIAHPLAEKIDTLEDAERLISPDTVSRIREWFRTYKVADGGRENTYAFDGRPCNKDWTLRLIKEMHESWKRCTYALDHIN